MQLIPVYVLNKHVPESGLTAGMKRETTSITFTEDMFTLKVKVKRDFTIAKGCIFWV